MPKKIKRFSFGSNKIVEDGYYEFEPEGCFETNEPRLEMAKFEYEDIKSFSPGVSPASYYCFSHPLYDLDYERNGRGHISGRYARRNYKKILGREKSCMQSGITG